MISAANFCSTSLISVFLIPEALLPSLFSKSRSVAVDIEYYNDRVERIASGGF